MTVADLDDTSPERAARALEEFNQLRNVPMYAPPSLTESIMIPGTLGGIRMARRFLRPPTATFST
jgi:hypothetical protein